MCNLMDDLRNDMRICSNETNTFKNDMMKHIMNQIDEFQKKKEDDINTKMNNVLKSVILKICDKFELDNTEVMECVNDEFFTVITEETEEENETDNIINEEVCVVIKEKQSNICNAWIKTKNCKCEKLRKPDSEYCGYHRNYKK